MKIATLNSRKRHAGPKPKPEPLRLDLGAGQHKREGFKGIDQFAFPGVDARCDLSRSKWYFEKGALPGLVRDFRGPWPSLDKCGPLEWFLPDNSVAEVHTSHFVEHLWNTQDRPERVRFVNELYRVLVPGGKCTMITPHYASCRAYGDFTHAYPPVAEFWFFYLKKDWRDSQAPHNDVTWNPVGYTCNFECTWGYSLEASVAARNQEYQQFALQFYREAAQDTIATLVKPLSGVV